MVRAVFGPRTSLTCQRKSRSEVAARFGVASRLGRNVCLTDVVGATLYGGDDGKVQDTSSGTAQATALEAATAENDEVEVLPL